LAARARLILQVTSKDIIASKGLRRSRAGFRKFPQIFFMHRARVARMGGLDSLPSNELYPG
jgi:hypothetical protein